MNNPDDSTRSRQFRSLRSFGDGKLLKHVGTLMSATVVSQLIAIAAQPIISRLYSDDQLGLFALWLAVPQIVVVVAALRYDMAIVLPEEESEARQLLRVSLLLVLANGILVTVICWVFSDPIAALIGNPELAAWLPWSGVAVVSLATVKTMSFWFTRQTRYNVISLNRIQMSSTISIGKISWALLRSPSAAGLVGGHLLGQLLAAGTLMHRGRTAVFRPSGSSTPVRQLLHRYRKMPLLNAPNALIDGFRLNGITLLVGAAYSASGVGQFSQAWLLMQAPVTLVAGAMSQVFFQRFASARPGELSGLVRKSLLLSASLAFVPFVVLLIFAPLLFPWFLGDQWETAGHVGQALVPWLFLNVASSPISTIFVVTNRQQISLGFSVVYMAVPLGLLAVLGPNLGLVQMTWVLSVAMALLLLGMIAMTLRVAVKFDRGGVTFQR